MDKIQEIEELLFNKYNTSFSVSLDKFGYIILPNDNVKLAYELEVELDSQNYIDDLDKIEKAVNLIF